MTKPVDLYYVTAMPSKSPAQARLMAAVAHNPKFAKKVGIPQTVGREFNTADKKSGAHYAAPSKIRRGTMHRR